MGETLTREQKRAAAKDALLSPIFKANPLFVMLLGTCPALAVTKNLETAIGMGFLFLFVLTCSNVLVSLLKKVIPEEVTTPCYIVIIATFVTLTKLLTNAFLPGLYTSLGVFLSLLVVNCIVLGRAEAYASKNTVFNSFLDGIGNAIGYMWAICLMAIIREVLGTGMITFGRVFTFIPLIRIPILKFIDASGVVRFDFSISLFQNPTGAFLVYGVILAVIAAIGNRKKRKETVLKRLAAQKAKEGK